jgi:hypothetical protein
VRIEQEDPQIFANKILLILLDTAFRAQLRFFCGV